MKPILAVACIMGLAAAAELVARDSEPQPANVDALTAISHELESAKSEKTFVKIATDGNEWYGVPTHVLQSVVFIQTGGQRERAIVRLDRIIGLTLMNSREEAEAANELLQEAHAKLVTRSAEKDKSGPTISGTVTLDGQPLGHVLIRFERFKPRSSIAMQQTTTEDGTYEWSNDSFTEAKVVGEYRVSIDATDESDPVVVPEQYRWGRSPLTAEVKAGENVLNFDLKSE